MIRQDSSSPGSTQAPQLRAIVRAAAVVLLDEPTSHLDFHNEADIVDQQQMSLENGN